MTAGYAQYNSSAQRCVDLMEEIARECADTHVQTEHVLLAILRDRENAGHRFLFDLGVRTYELYEEVQRACTQGEGVKEKVKYSPRVNRVIDFADRERVLLGDQYIDTKHLLLGLIREGEGRAGKILLAKQLSLTTMREAAIKVYGINPLGQLLPHPLGFMVDSSEIERIAKGERWVFCIPAERMTSLAIDDHFRFAHPNGVSVIDMKVDQMLTVPLHLVWENFPGLQKLNFRRRGLRLQRLSGLVISRRDPILVVKFKVSVL